MTANGIPKIIDNFTNQFFQDNIPRESGDLTLPNFKLPVQDSGVGSRLSEYYLNWLEITDDKFALSVIKNGYFPQFKDEKPTLVKNPSPMEYKFPEVQQKALDKEVQNFIDNGVVEEVTDLSSPGFYSPLFVRPRSKDSPNKWRCIFNTSKLNKFIKAPKFRMESTDSIRQLLNLNEYAVKLDLSDAYLHVPLHKKFRPYMRFWHKGKAYQFRSISFGANFSPWIFSYLMSVCMKFFHKRSIQIANFLDDMIAKQLDPILLSKQTTFVIQVLSSLGWTVNLKKSITIPQSILDYIGMTINFLTGMVKPMEERWDRTLQLAQYFQTLKVAPASLWASLLGLLTSLQDLTSIGRLYVRPLQLHVNKLWTDRENLAQMIPVTQDCVKTIQWWTVRENVMAGVPWRHPKPEITLLSDSSDLGWGGSLNHQKVSGKWCEEVQNSHINHKELYAIWLTMMHFEKQIQNKSVMIATDNQSAVYYINKLGGTRSIPLLNLTIQLLLWCKERNIHLRARHIPGKYNVITDQLSRKGQIISTEWSIHPSIMDQIANTWEKPMVDLFATHLNHKLPLYYSPVPDQHALGVDSLSHNWTNLLGYAYPPPALIPKVLEKIQTENCTIFLIAPAWPSRQWYPKLLNLLVDFPRKISSSRKLLKQPISNIYHQNPEYLQLHVWKLSGNASEQKGFQKKLPFTYQRDVEHPPTSYIKQNGGFSVLGVRRNRYILSKLLSKN